MLPALLFLFLSFTLLSYDQNLSRLFPQTINNSIELNLSITQKQSFFKLLNAKLYYTGFDYKIKGKKTGAFYYTYVGNQCYFLLMSDKKKQSPATLTNVNVSVKAMTSASTYYDLLKNYSKELHWTVPTLREYTYNYYLSEPDYPKSTFFFIVAGIAYLLLLCLFKLILGLYYILNPGESDTASDLKLYGHAPAVLEEINAEWKLQQIFHYKQFLLTEHYFIYLGTLHTKVIAIDFIDSFKTEIIPREFKKLRFRDKYKIIIKMKTNIDKTFVLSISSHRTYRKVYLILDQLL